MGQGQVIVIYNSEKKNRWLKKHLITEPRDTGVGSSWDCWVPTQWSLNTQDYKFEIPPRVSDLNSCKIDDLSRHCKPSQTSRIIDAFMLYLQSGVGVLSTLSPGIFKLEDTTSSKSHVRVSWELLEFSKIQARSINHNGQL